MGQYLPLIITILVIAFIAFLIERRWRGPSDKKQTAAPPPRTQIKSDAKSSGGFRGLRDRVMPGRKPELTKQFQAWAAESLTDQQELRVWIASFSSEEAQSFTDQLASFCDEVNLDLAWLVQKKLDRDPKIEQAARQVVVDYCQACYQAAQAQADFNAFDTYQAMIQNPKSYRELNQKLFTELVNQNLADPVTPDLFLAPEDKRQEHMVAAINKASAKDRPKFMTILKQLLAEEDRLESPASGSWTAKITKPFRKADPITDDVSPSPAATA